VEEMMDSSKADMSKGMDEKIEAMSEMVERQEDMGLHEMSKPMDMGDMSKGMDAKIEAESEMAERQRQEDMGSREMSKEMGETGKQMDETSKG
jgi:hypothetical protein